MFLALFTSWKRRQFARGPRHRPLLQLEALESRFVPSMAPWIGYMPHTGDRIDTLIHQLLPGTHSSVEFFNDLTGWLATSIAPRVRGPGNSDTFLTQLAGDCTVRSAIFQAVAESLGVAVQSVAFHDVPYQENHEGDEVNLNGHWAFFDPTTGVYLARFGHLSQPLALSEARAHPARVQVMELTSPHWRGAWSHERDFTYVLAPDNILRWHGRIGFILRYTYLGTPSEILPPDPQ